MSYFFRRQTQPVVVVIVVVTAVVVSWPPLLLPSGFPPSRSGLPTEYFMVRSQVGLKLDLDTSVMEAAVVADTK